MKRRLFYILFILIIGTGTRLIFFRDIKPIQFLQNDSYSYIRAAIDMENKHIWVHPHRTPLYPFFLKYTFSIFGGLSANINSPQFVKSAELTVYVQSVIGILTLIFIYFLSHKVLQNELFTVIFCFFISINPIIIFWERHILPESLTLSWVIFMSYFSLHTIERASFKKLFILSSLFIIGILLRPIYIFISPLILLLVMINNRSMDVIIKSIFSFVFVIFVIVNYIFINWIYYNYLGISNIGGINMLGLAIKYHLKADKINGFNILMSEYTKYLSISDKDPTPYKFMEINRGMFSASQNGNLANFNQLDSFTRNLILTNFWEYIQKSIISIPSNLFEESLFPYFRNNYIYQYLKFWLFINTIQQLYLFIFLITYPLLFLYRIINKRIINTRHVVIEFVIYYQLFMSLFVSYTGYYRLLFPVLPISFLLISNQILKFINIIYFKINYNFK